MDALIIDVRTPKEYEEGHLVDAINIPIYEFEKKIEDEVSNKEQTIIVYCSSGTRSKEAIKILKNNGYKNLYHILNGIEI